MCVATMDRYGRITIPAKVRADLGLQPGDRVQFVKTPAGMRIRKAEPNR